GIEVETAPGLAFDHDQVAHAFRRSVRCRERRDEPELLALATQCFLRRHPPGPELPAALSLLEPLLLRDWFVVRARQLMVPVVDKEALLSFLEADGDAKAEERLVFRYVGERDGSIVEGDGL